MENDQSDEIVKAFAEDAQEVLNDWERACLRVGEKPIEETMRVLLRCAHNLKGNAGLIGFIQLSEAVHRLEDRLIAISKMKVDPSDQQLMGILFEIEKFLRNWVDGLNKDPKFEMDNTNVLAKLENWPSAGADTFSSNQGAPDHGSGETTARPANARQTHERESSGSSAITDTIRIPSTKLDRLIQLVGELSLAQAIVARGSQEGTLNSGQVREAIALCDKISGHLRTIVLDLRMLPMGGLYQRLERAGMEASVRLKKPVQFITEGSDVSVDKAILHRIFDPLLHMVRNSIDHGIESPDDRKAAGKLPTGTVKIRSEIGARGVIIRVSDDGRGISREKILKKGIEKGLVNASSDLASISDKDVFDLIFQPGFSTADEVTDMSGRGVGMDVVLKEVVSLGGFIETISSPGMGTEFQITLPTNISLIDVLVARVHGILYGVPTQDVSEILDVGDYKIEQSAAFEQMINYRTMVMPVENLEKFLPNHEPVSDKSAPEQQGCILVTQGQDQTVGFRVDTVEGQQQVFIRPLKGYLSQLPWLTGSTILSNGEPALIVNLKEVANGYANSARRRKRFGEHTI